MWKNKFINGVIMQGVPRGLTKEDRRYPGYEFKDYDLNQEEFPLTDNVSNTENMFEKNG